MGGELDKEESSDGGALCAGRPLHTHNTVHCWTGTHTGPRAHSKSSQVPCLQCCLFGAVLKCGPGGEKNKNVYTLSLQSSSQCISQAEMTDRKC